MVAAGYATVSTFTTPATANYLRFQTFASDAGAAAHDLDMFVYRAAPGSSSYVLVATSGGPDQNEVVNTNSAGSLAAGAQFKVYVHGCSVDAGGADVTLFAWALTDPATNPFSAVPAAQAVTIGQVVPGTLSWTGLPAGNRYLGPRAVRRSGRSDGRDGGDHGRGQHALENARSERHEGPANRRPFVVSEEYRERVHNRVLVYAEAVDVAAEGAVWYARCIAGGPFTALHVPGKSTDSGIHARWFDFTGGEPRLDVLPAGSDATTAVLEAIARLRQETARSSPSSCPSSSASDR